MSIKILDDYIELKNLQIKQPFEKIDLGSGHLLGKKEDSATLEFTIDQYTYNKLNKNSNYILEINGKRYKFVIEEVNEKHVILNIHDLNSENENYHAVLLNDMSFIIKKEKQVLEEFKSDKYSILREKLFGSNKIYGGNLIEIINKNDNLNDLQKKAVSYASGVEDLFLIWGPPGTGKTTLVPEIAKNYCEIWKKENNKTPKILLCAWTNTAVDNVVRKLKKENYSVIRYGKGTKLNNKEYILYDNQEKTCIEKIEKQYILKLNIIESKKKDIEKNLKAQI